MMASEKITYLDNNATTAIDPAVLEGCLSRYPYVYQHAADDAVPIWQLRHPELARGQ